MEHPILMTTESVKAILDGRKTMTRRVIKDPRRKSRERDAMSSFSSGKPSIADMQAEARMDLKPNFPCPYGQVGDRLWVRETHMILKPFPKFKSLEEDLMMKPSVYYKATDRIFKGEKWRPSIFMPRWASRITLEITGVRVERLQEITEADMLSEGILSSTDKSGIVKVVKGLLFTALWDSLNAKRGYGWDKNPWVWCLSFKRLQ